MRHSRSRTPIGRRYRSPSADRESSEPQLILPYEGLDEDGLDTDRGCWLVPNRERVDRRWRSPSRGVASGVVRAPVRVRAPVYGPSRDAFGVRDPVGTSAGVLGPCPVRDPGPVRAPVRTSRGVRAPTRASVDDRSRSRLRDHHSSSSPSSDSDEGRRTFQQRGERGRRRRRSPRAASAEHPLATLCDKLLQSMGALRADNATLSERLGALERRSSVADPTPLPSTPRLREEEGDSAFEDELSLEAPGDSFCEEELPRDWLPRDMEPMSLEVSRQHTDDTSVVLTTSANPTSEVQPSADEPGWRRYRETLRAVYRYHPSIPLPEAPVDETFGGALSALCQGQVREDRYSSLPQSGALTNALRHVNGVVRGIVHSPLEAADRVRGDAQKWGSHLSLPSPPIRQYRQEYYRMHYPVGLLEEERLLPHTPWSTSAASSVLKRGAPAEVKVRVSQMKDWEMLARAGLGVTNHLDWFMGSIWQILVGVDLGQEKSADLTIFLTSSCVAVNQLAHIQARTLAILGRFRRPGAHFLRSQAIGCVDLLAGRGHEALRTASEEQRTALLFDTTVGASRRPVVSATSGQSRRPRSHAQRRRRGGFVATNQASARRRPNPTPPATPARRQVERGRRGRLGVTRTFDPKPKV